LSANVITPFAEVKVPLTTRMQWTRARTLVQVASADVIALALGATCTIAWRLSTGDVCQ
jgi:hypothetical protein